MRHLRLQVEAKYVKNAKCLKNNNNNLEPPTADRDARGKNELVLRNA